MMWLASAIFSGAAGVALKKVSSGRIADAEHNDSSPVIGPADIAGPWPEGLSFKREVKSQAHWEMSSASREWGVRQMFWRNRLLGRATTWGDTLKLGVLGDDGSPSDEDILWKNYSEFKLEHDGSFWRAVCNGTDPEQVAAIKGPADLPLHGWTVKNSTFCSESDQLEGEYASESDAVQHCGDSCYSVMDLGCERQTFRLCKIGAEEQAATDGTCLRLRMPNHRPPDGKPSKPVEREFWKAFCSEVNYRLLFHDRLCMVGKVMPEASSVSRCAELVAKDPTCTEIFDYAEAESQPVCRCATAGAACNPQTVPDDESPLARDVFKITRPAVPAAP